MVDDTPQKPTLISERQAAGYLGITLDELRHEVNQGRLHKHTQRRYRQSDLDLWRSNLAKMLAGKFPDIDLSGIARTQRYIERQKRSRK